MAPEVRAFWERTGVKFLCVKPLGQMSRSAMAPPHVTLLQDTQGRIKDWFGAQKKAVVFIRPDRFVAALASPQEVDAVSHQLAQRMAQPVEA
ncbi:3-(3-hydroxy-phenyl)propionate/3-hydroxycinnamic acid hydroxylase [compost metagenome]